MPGSLIHISTGGMGLLITKFLTNEAKYPDFYRSMAAQQQHVPGLDSNPLLFFRISNLAGCIVSDGIPFL